MSEIHHLITKNRQSSGNGLLRMAKDGAISYLEAKINGTWTRINGLVQKISTDVDDATDRTNANAVPNTAAVYTKTQTLSARIDALQGSYVYRGSLASGTEATQANLTAYIVANYSRQPQLGDVIVDNDAKEWYYNGTLWTDMGAPDQNKMDKLTGSSLADKILTSDADGQAQATAKSFGGATFNATPNQATIPNESSVRSFVEGKGYAVQATTLSGYGITDGLSISHDTDRMAHQRGDISLYVGPNREFQTIQAAYNFIQKYAVGNAAVIYVYLDYVEGESYEMPNWYQSINRTFICSADSSNKVTISNYFLIDFCHHMRFENLIFSQGLRCLRSNVLYFSNCDFYSSYVSVAGGHACIVLNPCATVNMWACNLYGSEGYTNVATGAFVADRSYFESGGNTVFHNLALGCNARIGSFVNIEAGSGTTFDNVTTVSSPAADTFGNRGAYVTR